MSTVTSELPAVEATQFQHTPYYWYIRILHASLFFKHFASDRRHIKEPDGSWIAQHLFHPFISNIHFLGSKIFSVILIVFFVNGSRDNKSSNFPATTPLKKLLPLSASSLEFGSAVAPALTALLAMGSWLSA